MGSWNKEGKKEVRGKKGHSPSRTSPLKQDTKRKALLLLKKGGSL